MEEEALSSRLSTQEKLLIAQAVYKYGALDWDKISGLLVNHPVVEGRPAEWFDTTTCEAYYVGLMTEAGINVPAQDAARPQAKVHLRLAQRFYFARLQELKSSIAAYEQRFTTLMSEIAAIKSGSMDKTIKDEIRAVLARKFGKRLLDSWVPDEDAVKEALEAGPPAKDENGEAPPTANEPELGEKSAATKDLEVDADLTTTVEDAAPEMSEAPAEETVEIEATDAPEAAQEDENMEEETPPKQLSPVKDRAPTPFPTDIPPTSSPSRPSRTRASAHSTPASDFTPPPEDKAGQSSPTKHMDEEASAPATRNSKRKASTQPRGAPTTKRSTRRKTSATPAALDAEPEAEAADAEKVKEADKEDNQAAAAAVQGETAEEAVEADGKEGEDAAVEEEEAEDEVPATRGRRAAKRDSMAGARTKKATSPASSSRQQTPPGKRDTSVSSVKSPTPVEERRSSRRGGPKGRGMRDEVVSKSVREQSAAVESVKEEEEAEPERLPTRSSRRAKDNTTPVPDMSAALPDQRRGTRRSSTRAAGPQGEAEDEKPQVEDEEKDKKLPKRPRLSSPRESKAAKRMLNGLLDQISSHRNGSVFAKPITEKEVPDYHKVIKRPMDLGTIKRKVREGQITTIDEFERDIMLMFANATMFNAKGSPTHDMAIEMMKDAEGHIQHLRSVQHHIGR